MLRTALLITFAAAGIHGANPPVAETVTADHVALHVADTAASIAFYHDAFGLREIPTAVAIARWMDLGRGLQLHLVSGRTRPVVTALQVHLALRTPNLARTIDYLRAHGMRWQDNQGNVGRISSVRTDGVRQIFLQDPDGYWIEVNGTLPPGYPE
jgi:lactoylglutathione lyase